MPEDALRTETFTASTGHDAAPDAPRVSVTFARQARTVQGARGATLLDIAQGAGVDIPVVCGTGSCGACRVRLVSGQVKHPGGTALTPPDEAEGFILACQSRPQSDVTVDAWL